MEGHEINKIKFKRQMLFYDLIELIQLFEVGDSFYVDDVEFYIDENYHLVYRIGYDTRYNIFDLSLTSIENIISKLENVAKDKGYI